MSLCRYIVECNDQTIRGSQQIWQVSRARDVRQREREREGGREVEEEREIRE